MMDDPVRRAILGRADAATLRTEYQQQRGYVPLRAVAEDLIARGITDNAEVRRVLGE